MWAWFSRLFPADLGADNLMGIQRKFRIMVKSLLEYSVRPDYLSQHLKAVLNVELRGNCNRGALKHWIIWAIFSHWRIFRESSSIKPYFS